MRVLGLLIVGILLGSCIGAKLGGDPAHVEFIRIPGPTKTVEKEVQGSTIYVTPESCLRAFDYTDEVARQAEKIYNVGDKQLNIISETRQALAGDGDLSEVENKQRALQSNTVDNLEKMEVAASDLNREEEKCREEVK